MASPTSTTEEHQPWAGRVIRHDDFAKTLQARRETLGEPNMPRNAGSRRTLSKVALLTAIKDVGGDW
ncbi:hypothetical protein [Sphingomonas mollis]|uniref:Uncharacterized protein n=1 Tax=Sphingomonas mollis TaxID=2795726 RepID=A0ABS0XNP0_9SPHN|nr:hypothetical protein [Sphingomonas sp. BT553]MBJ6121353.1 hypothetical protein [Sphingomonas sp. BT553]